MLLYIHVPFCRKKCAYCAFYSVPLAEGRRGMDMVKGYVGTLLGELGLWGERLGKKPVETVFFGGGTPSLLPGKAIAGILSEIDKTFALDTAAEITVEANPESALADGWLFEAKKAGVNRLSLGVQSFNDADLVRLGRAHNARMAEAAFDTARAAGFINIGLDFMWGLPGEPERPQAQARWLKQLKQATDLRPEHISAYGLTLEEGSALAASCAGGAYALPSESELASMYLAGADFLEGRGFMHYEISNYARIGFECRHNLGYWQGADYLGLGPAATSTLAGRRWTNPSAAPDWRRLVRDKSIGNDAETLDARSKLKELLMLRLRMSKGLSLQAYQACSGRSFQEDFGSLVRLLQKSGLAASRKGWFRLTRPGMLVSDTILAHFFAGIDDFSEG
jgi:oxygen-independent coproporphyrinogen-3 oxidase